MMLSNTFVSFAVKDSFDTVVYIIYQLGDIFPESFLLHILKPHCLNSKASAIVEEIFKVFK